MKHTVVTFPIVFVSLETISNKIITSCKKVSEEGVEMPRKRLLEVSRIRYKVECVKADGTIRRTSMIVVLVWKRKDTST